MRIRWSSVRELCIELSAVAGEGVWLWVEDGDANVVAGESGGDRDSAVVHDLSRGDAVVARVFVTGPDGERWAKVIVSACRREFSTQETIYDMAEAGARQWRQTNALLSMVEGAELFLRPGLAAEKILNILHRSTDMVDGLAVVRLPGEKVYTAFNDQRHENVLDPKMIEPLEEITDDVRVIHEADIDARLGSAFKRLRRVKPPVVFARVGTRRETFGFLLVSMPGVESTMSADLKVLASASRVLGVALENHYLLSREREATRLKVANELLETQTHDMEELIHVVAHDLRSPMTSMYGFMHVAVDEISDLRKLLEEKKFDEVLAAPDLIEEPLNDGLRSVEKLNRMVQRLLDYSRSSRLSYRFETLSMKALAEDVVDLLKPQLNEKSIEVDLPDLPSVTGDRAQVEAIYSNLIGNAIKYMGNRGHGKISCGFIQASDPIFFVRDTGVGLNPDELEAVFQPFKRFNNDDTPGEGIGLAQVRKIVDRHGGRVWCESTKGQGATFFFTLGRNAVGVQPGLTETELRA